VYRIKHRHRFRHVKLVLRVEGIDMYVWVVSQCECGELKLEKKMRLIYDDYMEKYPHEVIHVSRFRERDSLVTRTVKMKIYQCECGFIGDSYKMSIHLVNEHDHNLKYAEKIGLIRPTGETITKVIRG